MTTKLAEDTHVTVRKEHKNTEELTREVIHGWVMPDFLPPIKETAKVKELRQEVERTGILPGVIILAIVNGVTYILGGRHRVYGAFDPSNLPSVLADLIIYHNCSFEDMGRIADKDNAQLHGNPPDHKLRTKEVFIPHLKRLREQTVTPEGNRILGYDGFRKSTNAPILSMSRVIISWRLAAPEIPQCSVGSAESIACTLTPSEVNEITNAVFSLYRAWGPDGAINKLWSQVNLVPSFWMQRHWVMKPFGSNKITQLTPTEYEHALMALSADDRYRFWLAGRSKRLESYAEVFRQARRLMEARLRKELNRRAVLPESPSWALEEVAV